MVHRIISIGFIFSLLLLISLPAQASDEVYERVMSSGKLRCGYNFYEPGFVKNEETGEFRGLFYDLMEDLGHISDIEIEWTQITDWGGILADLESGKIDAFCISVWPNAQRGKVMLLTNPFLYVNVEAYARADDTRFDDDLSAINSPDVTISVIDGDISFNIARTDFPNAKARSIVHLGSDADAFNELKFGKADVTFSTHSAFIGYDRENPDALKRLDASQPLRTFGTTIAIPMGEFKLQAFLNTAITQMINSGNVDRILAKYETDYPDAFFPVARPFRQ